ncbi:MAG: hypothetical protein QM572_14365 [Nocardioides sp.]|uniref:pilus assembly protein TadG-related protein n=1 Tax=Nocardioides sp. TaxID=35761 RepID=UPI0039E48943
MRRATERAFESSEARSPTPCPSSRARPDGSQRGSTIPLILGFTAILLVAAAVAIDATAAWLQRQSLESVADGAALHAADLAAQGTEVYSGGLGDRLRLDDEVARRSIEEFLHRTRARERFPGLSFTVGVDGDRVSVDVRAPLDLPLRVPGSPEAPIVHGRGGAVVTVDAGDNG